jgi:hypothetical protein
MAAILCFLLLLLQAVAQALVDLVESLMVTQAALVVALFLVDQVELQVQRDKVMQAAQLTLHLSLVVAAVVVQVLAVVEVILLSVA